MTNKTQVSETIKEPLIPVPPATALMSFRLPTESITFLDALVESGGAKDRTDAIVQSLRRCQEAFVMAPELRKIAGTQVGVATEIGALKRQLSGFVEAIQEAGDAINALKAQQEVDHAVFSANLNALIDLRIYGPGVADSDGENGSGGRTSELESGGFGLARRPPNPTPSHRD